jgi:hypothetical protein
VAGSWNYSPKEVKCDLECMTPECGYDFGGCDDELAVTGFNKIDFEIYLAFIVSTYLFVFVVCLLCVFARQIMPEACV